MPLAASSTSRSPQAARRTSGSSAVRARRRSSSLRCRLAAESDNQQPDEVVTAQSSTVRSPGLGRDVRAAAAPLNCHVYLHMATGNLRSRLRHIRCGYSPVLSPVHLRRFVPLALVAVAVASPSAQGRAPSLTDRARAAERIVVGDVTSATPAWRVTEHGDRLIVTVLRVATRETLKGAAQSAV